MNFINGDLADGTFKASGMTIPMGSYGFTRDANGGAVLGVRPEHVAVGEQARKMPFQFESDPDSKPSEKTTFV
jgi:multiple sugar transport system ATP-binding protein